MCTPSSFYSASSCPDIANKGGRHAELSSQGTNTFRAVANFCNGLIRQFFRWVSVTTAFNFVGHVVLLRSLDQMSRVYTWRIVASVADYFCFRNLPVMHFVRQPVCADQFIASLANHSVSVKSGPAKPRPAFICATFINLLPKPICNGPGCPFSGVGRSAFWRTIFRYCCPIGFDLVGHPANCACQINHRSMLT